MFRLRSWLKSSQNCEHYVAAEHLSWSTPEVVTVWQATEAPTHVDLQVDIGCARGRCGMPGRMAPRIHAAPPGACPCRRSLLRQPPSAALTMQLHPGTSGGYHLRSTWKRRNPLRRGLARGMTPCWN